jgi:hypothetical protein
MLILKNQRMSKKSPEFVILCFNPQNILVPRLQGCNITIFEELDFLDTLKYQ